MNVKVHEYPRKYIEVVDDLYIRTDFITQITKEKITTYPNIYECYKITTVDHETYRTCQYDKSFDNFERYLNSRSKYFK